MPPAVLRGGRARPRLPAAAATQCRARGATRELRYATMTLERDPVGKGAPHQ
jgi:hypothetical protein